MKNVTFGIITQLELAFNAIVQYVLNISHLVLVIQEQEIQGDMKQNNTNMALFHTYMFIIS
jgi:hypothetical protein